MGDTRRVDPDSERKSVSAETTFEEDICDVRPLQVHLWRLCEKVSARMKTAGLAGQTVTLKLKGADFTARTRAARLADPTQLADRLFVAGRQLLEREATGTRFRLIGIGLSDLTGEDGADPADLADPDLTRRMGAERAVDRVREKFGRDMVQRGIAFRARPKRDAGDD